MDERRKTMSPVSEKQYKILEFIRSFHQKRGFPPSVREIGTRFGIKSPNGVKYHLDVLEREGLLNREPGTSRGLTPTGEGSLKPQRSVPVVGRVAAGGPNLAFQEIEREVVVDPELFGENDDSLFALRIVGDSMKNAGIFEGDIAVVRRQQTADSGDIVVAMIDGDATVKRYIPQKNKIVLQPENETYKPITVQGEQLGEFSILGKVVGLLRTKI